ncbi:uroporphyrinogen-III synthase [Parasedimentitalea marina]|uniref:Uroporphyrinogen-III synthase n=1 Tax=Parasedimentitalea marina TaxID=2483033 RepID=A0A3T0N7T8_9RHOB|nr:uroporphyrinogen-III synthase [Parasedimentitalea marina]AZV80100.1 uroporphyrinogen-III synthase [Parasedimentitalea marina]
MAVLLMTRPQNAARRFVAMLPATLTAKLQIIYAPLMSVQPVGQDVTLLKDEAVIFTSANGVSATASIPDRDGRTAYCLGRHTRQIAEDAGWQAQMCGNTADDVVADLLQRRPSGLLVHLRGQHSRGQIAERLSKAGLPCREKIIYEQRLLTLTDEANSALSATQDVIVPIFSPRTARQFADLCPIGSGFHLIAMSGAVAEPLKSLKYRDLRICSEPDAQSMALLVQDVAATLIRVESDRSAQ